MNFNVESGRPNNTIALTVNFEGLEKHDILRIELEAVKIFPILSELSTEALETAYLNR